MDNTSKDEGKKLEWTNILIFNNEKSPHVNHQITLKAKHLFEKKFLVYLEGTLHLHKAFQGTKYF